MLSLHIAFSAVCLFFGGGGGGNLPLYWAKRRYSSLSIIKFCLYNPHIFNLYNVSEQNIYRWFNFFDFSDAGSLGKDLGRCLLLMYHFKHSPCNPGSGVTRTRKLRSHLMRTQSYRMFSRLRPGVGQNRAMNASPIARSSCCLICSLPVSFKSIFLSPLQTYSDA